MWEVFGTCSLIIILGFLFKEGAKKMPLGCLAFCLFMGYIFIKACTEMQEEERERKEWNEQFQKHLKEIDDESRSKRK